jgi:hypothetical protein
VAGKGISHTSQCQVGTFDQVAQDALLLVAIQGMLLCQHLYSSTAFTSHLR